MGARVLFTPLLSSDTVSPSAYLLQLASDPEHSVTLLLDAGWDERFDEASVNTLLVCGLASPTLQGTISMHSTHHMTVTHMAPDRLFRWGCAGSGTKGGCCAAQSPRHRSFGRNTAAGGTRRLAGARTAGLRHRWQAVASVHVEHEHCAAAGSWMQAPVYATVPVQRMGQVTMRDACRAQTAESDAPPFSLGDVDRAFAHVTQLRWRETVIVPGSVALQQLNPPILACK
jgi:Metallo-beta-lactamase superfamily domain